MKRSIFDKLLLWVIGFIFICSWSDLTSHTVEDAARFRSLVEGKDWSQIRTIADQTEADWLNAPDASYFFQMTCLCKAISSAANLKPSEYLYLQDLASRILLKPFTSGIGSEPEAWHAKCEIAHIILRDMPFHKTLTPEAFSTFRSRNAALLELFCKQVQSIYKKNYKPKQVFLNIGPPVNVDSEPFIAGMDPKQIKNPQSRSAYEAALKENAINAKENSVQAMLERFIKNDIPDIIRGIEAQYSHEPKNTEEFEAYFNPAIPEACFPRNP